MTGFSCTPNTALAAAITNLSDQDVVMEVGIGTNLTPVTIKAGETYRVETEIKVRYKDHEVNLASDDEYALWPGGDFGPQAKERHLDIHGFSGDMRMNSGHFR